MKKVFIWGLLTYIKFLAKLSLFIHKPKVVGIAGSVGKTSTRNALYAGLKDSLKIKLIEGNSETGVPLGILGIEPESYTFKDWFKICLKAPFGLNYIKGFDYLIIEMGIDDPNPPKNMSYLLTIVKPDIAISMNATAAHTHQFEKVLPNKNLSDEERYDLILKAIAQEDTQIITKSGCKFAIYNNDDPYVVESILHNLNIPKVELFNMQTNQYSKLINNKNTPDLLNNEHSTPTPINERTESTIPGNTNRTIDQTDNFGLPINERTQNQYAKTTLGLSKTGIVSLPNTTPTFLTFGQTENSTITLRNYSVNLNGTDFGFQFSGDSQLVDVHFDNVVMPEVYKDSFSVVLLVAKILDLDIQQIAKSLAQNFVLPNGRSSILQGINNSFLIDSSYNASKSSMLAFLDLMKKLKTNNQPIVVVFGDIRELGSEAEMEHRQVANRIIEVANYCYCVGDLTQKYVMPIIQNQMIETKWFKTSLEAGKYLTDHLPNNSLVLIKGSQNEIFLEEITYHLLANLNDQNKLCRQSAYWIKRRKEFFNSMDQM